MCNINSEKHKENVLEVIYLEIGNVENKLESDGVLKNNEIWVEGDSRDFAREVK